MIVEGEEGVHEAGEGGGGRLIRQQSVHEGENGQFPVFLSLVTDNGHPHVSRCNITGEQVSWHPARVT